MEAVFGFKKATHTTSFIIPGKAEVRYTITALRNLPYSGLIEVEVKALDQIQMQCFNQMDVPNSYIDVKKRLVEANVGLDAGKEMILQAEALSAQKAHKVVASSEFLFDHKKLTFRNEDQVKNSIEGNLKKGETIKFSLVGSICTSRDFNDPKVSPREK